MILERLDAAQVAPYIEQAAGEDLPAVLSEVVSGTAQAFRVDQGELYMVTRLERQPAGPELVVVALEGRGLDRVAPMIIAQATAIGCTTIRYHTRRMGLNRKLARYGFQESERVYKVKI